MIDHWQSQIQQAWGITEPLTRLDGEYDLNFAAGDVIFKVMRAECDPALVDMQVKALNLLQRHPVPGVVPSLDGAVVQNLSDADGAQRLVWAVEKLEGQTYAVATPKTLGLAAEIGSMLGAMDADLNGFDHPFLARDCKWNLAHADWIAAYLECIKDPRRRNILADINNEYSTLKLEKLPIQAIHNDANDYNLIVNSGAVRRHLTGIIDFGDMCAAPRVCELAIAGAYLVLDHDQPERMLAELVRGYHSVNPLTEGEVDLLVPLLRMRLAVSVVNSTLMANENPDDPYVTVSQAPAWRYLEGDNEHPKLLTARLRAACGFCARQGSDRVLAWLNSERGNFAPVMGIDLSDAPAGSLSVEQSIWPENPFDLPLEEAAEIGREFGQGPWLGYYNEPRLIYTAPAFRLGQWAASDRRTVHLAVDVFLPKGSPVFAPLDGKVLVAEYRAGHLDYGGVIILEHQTPDGDAFYTLYGHLDPNFSENLSVGDHISKGQEFCQLGDVHQNGGWAPHLHFQLALMTDGMDGDWPGVGAPDDMYLWEQVCPNPAVLLNLPDTKTRYEPIQPDGVYQERTAFFASNLSLSYSEPVMLMRGWQHHLFDEWGRPYLDAYNNVPHVGHAHPRIRAVAAAQLGRMNSNTRYLHPAQTALAEKVLSKMPDGLDTVFLVNSGTEANELALRLCRAHTGAKGMVTPDHGYHGNTTGVIDISAYKFNAKGGVGQADWVELVDLPDMYRGTGGFADQVGPAIETLAAKGQGVAGFIAETFPSVAGQIIPPPNYLKTVYKQIRAAGGICIADEVQTGLGRLGEYYFGFEQQGVVPDIVVMGKPIGNGHPVGVLVTRREIADSFATGPEFFSTFGGSNLSCVIAKEVLDIVDDEELQANARNMGDSLLAGLRDLAETSPHIGDVRGMGLFCGVDLIEDKTSKTEATDLCQYVKNRMRENRILIGSEGPKDNVLKIRPPLTIDAEGVEMIVSTLAGILAEVT